MDGEKATTSPQVLAKTWSRHQFELNSYSISHCFQVHHVVTRPILEQLVIPVQRFI